MSLQRFMGISKRQNVTLTRLTVCFGKPISPDSTYQIKIEPAKNENGQFFDMLMAEELDSKNLDNAGIDGQISFGEDAFYQKYEQKIKLLTDKFMPPKDEDEHLRAQKRKEGTVCRLQKLSVI